MPIDGIAGAPRISSQPRPGAVHSAGRVQLIGKALGTPLMPWQYFAARLITERHPLDQRRYRFRTVVITVPRQAGKTTLIRTLLTERALTAKRRAFYTAQTGKDARARWLDLVNALDAGPLQGMVHKRLAAGTSELTFPSGSTIAPFAPTPESLHGYTPHDVVIDEGFAFDSAQGEALMGAIKPAQITLPDRQLIIVSTMGTADSGFLNDWIAKGRDAAANPNSDIGYLEYSLAPGLDAYDPDNWGFHPAIGHTISVDDLAEASQMHTAGEWNRAYMNRFTVATETVLDLDQWDSLAGEQQPVSLDRVAVAYDIGHDRARSAIVGAWYDLDGMINVRIIRSEPGSTWLVPEVTQLYNGSHLLALGADDGGLTRGATDDLRQLPDSKHVENEGIRPETLSGRDSSTAWENFKGLVKTGLIRHEGSAALRRAIESAAERRLGDIQLLSRRDSSGPIPELVAAATAIRLLQTAPSAAPKPLIYVPRQS